jgi:MFS superfamily sulfate permease-like transporter
MGRVWQFLGEYSPRLPIVTWLPKYTRAYIPGDIIAGLTVGLMVVPQGTFTLVFACVANHKPDFFILTPGIAYAYTVAGLPAQVYYIGMLFVCCWFQRVLNFQYGLYSSFIGLLVYMLLGTAKDITLGPTAIMSLMVSSQAVGSDGTTDVSYAIFLAFFSGLIQFAMGLFHLGTDQRLPCIKPYLICFDVCQASSLTLFPSLCFRLSRLVPHSLLPQGNSRLLFVYLIVLI